jgi:hypothetical protein
VQQGRLKFAVMGVQTSFKERLRHFEEMFKMVFAILGFSVPKSKISAEVVNPVIQYLIIKSEVDTHYRCL